MAIKMLGLDLDGTALNENSMFSEATKKAFLEAKKKGVHIIISTGRALCALPEEIYSIEGLDYVATSNGARVIETKNNNTIYKNCIAPEAMDKIYEILRSEQSLIEVFVGGKAYISREEYDAVMNGRISHRSAEYVRNTRTPKDNIYDLLIEEKGEIENINVNYRNVEEREAMEEKLKTLTGVTLTSSLPLNNELGGETTSKADALEFLMNKLGVSREELLCCGDNPNDIAMIKLAGIGVAMGNAEDSVKEAADFVTLPNYEDGVAYAIEKFVL